MLAGSSVAGVKDEAPGDGPPARRFCFVEGTHVSTLRGDMPVEQLRAGDHIRAKTGSFHTVTEVLVIAFDDLGPEAQPAVGLYPIKRGAFDEGLPRRDVYVSAGQEFELSRRLEIAHAVRMAVRKEGAALGGLRFVLFACPGLPMIRAEGIWTTRTPIERAFPAIAPEAWPATQPETAPLEALQDPGPDVTPRPVRRSTSRLLRPLATDPETWEPSDASPDATVPMALAPTGMRAATRPRVTRFLRSPVPDPVSVPGPHRTETGTPAP